MTADGRSHVDDGSMCSIVLIAAGVVLGGFVAAGYDGPYESLPVALALAQVALGARRRS